MVAAAVVEWVERSTKRTLNPEQARCVQVLCSFSQPYNLQLIGGGWRDAVDYTWESERTDFIDDEPPLRRAVEFGKTWVTVYLLGTLSTFDFPELTRLVLTGHEHAVRVEISPQIYRWVQDDDIHEGEEPMTGPGACLRIQLNARQRERGADGHVWDWHPTIEQVLERG